MKPNTYDEMIEVIQALKAGKRVEVRAHGGCAWISRPADRAPNFWDNTYRVAREPVRLWVVVDRGGHPDQRNWFCKASAECAAADEGGTVAELVEVQK